VLEDLGEQFDRDPELVGDPLHADRGVALLLGDVLHRHEPVVDLLREAQHVRPFAPTDHFQATPHRISDQISRRSF
jgi:hypothetical protein